MAKEGTAGKEERNGRARDEEREGERNLIGGVSYHGNASFSPVRSLGWLYTGIRVYTHA